MLRDGIGVTGTNFFLNESAKAVLEDCIKHGKTLDWKLPSAQWG